MQSTVFSQLKNAISCGELRGQLTRAKEFSSPLVCVLGTAGLDEFLSRLPLESEVIEWLDRHKRPMVRVPWSRGLLWIVRPYLVGTLAPSAYAQTREALGAVLSALEEQGLKRVQLHFEKVDSTAVVGGLVGLGLAQYRYKRIATGIQKIFFEVSHSDGLDRRWFQEAREIASSVNMARHLTNLPPNELNPETFAACVKQLFRSVRELSVEIWPLSRLKKEKMGLHIAVGAGAKSPPLLVRLKYRPKPSKLKPIALIGKGITFDSGGLDIKPSSNMRWMKKDMGGAAAVVGGLYWAIKSNLKKPIDAYLAMAENSVDGRSYRPGDIIASRSGLKVEIHNTDAEGRLVLADALNVAVTQKGNNTARAVIDVATLTGANKVALGADVAGLYCNNDVLAQQLDAAGETLGDPVWRMPLYQKYKAQLQSTFADLVNSSDGFGGAITAALFLQMFVGERPWAHLDIYAWKDVVEGGQVEVGGSGQSVQTLIGFLKTF